MIPVGIRAEALGVSGNRGGRCSGTILSRRSEFDFLPKTVTNYRLPVYIHGSPGKLLSSSGIPALDILRRETWKNPK
jgi:hypothetical protein